MICEPEEIQVDMFYMGPGKGGVKIFRFDELSFKKEIDLHNEHKSRLELEEEVNSLIFQEFRKGNYSFKVQQKQEIATSVLLATNLQLIEKMYSENDFEADLIKRELKERKILDEDIYRIGFYGNNQAKNQAIKLLKDKTEQENTFGPK